MANQSLKFLNPCPICKVCSTDQLNDDEHVSCEQCKFWVHRGCSDIADWELLKDESFKYTCDRSIFCK
jgi:hypothetical protein